MCLPSLSMQRSSHHTWYGPFYLTCLTFELCVPSHWCYSCHFYLHLCLSLTLWRHYAGSSRFQSESGPDTHDWLDQRCVVKFTEGSASHLRPPSSAPIPPHPFSLQLTSNSHNRLRWSWGWWTTSGPRQGSRLTLLAPSQLFRQYGRW